MEEELGTRLPEEVRIVAVEKTADTIYLVLPITPTAGDEGVELSDRDLESVAGGDYPPVNQNSAQCYSSPWGC